MKLEILEYSCALGLEENFQVFYEKNTVKDVQFKVVETSEFGLKYIAFIQYV